LYLAGTGNQTKATCVTGSGTIRSAIRYDLVMYATTISRAFCRSAFRLKMFKEWATWLQEAYLTQLRGHLFPFKYHFPQSAGGRLRVALTKSDIFHGNSF
jgi:hypothetical protein